ncbi:DUF5105 domain-containing protein [Enterococcus sp.]|uniref:DUF5105 domain-containing protein n=1 Tax=Enterococcus sp. TaxID=35783 RepID=UPI002FCA2F59
MKKKWLAMVLFILTPLFIAGCAQAIPAKEAAPLLIDAMIYQKEDESFESNFANSETLTTAFEKHRESFEENFTKGLLQSNTEIDETVAKKISGLLMTQVQEVTSYEIKKVTETKPIHHVTYEIKGFDLSGLLIRTTQELLARIQKDNQIAKDQKKVIEETIAIIEAQIPETKATETTTEVTLQLKENRGKWEIVAGQDEALASLYLSFFAGVSNDEELAKEMAEAVTQVVVPSMGEPKTNE